ncbi:MAG TPA: hypothetical protein VGG48_01795 [Rhizomicrobium sp.]|jgi:hypothetical protein
MSKIVPIEPEHVRSALDFSLRKVRLEALRRRLTPEERDKLTQAITQHLQLCGWSVWHEETAAATHFNPYPNR